jgi:predicted ATPase
MAESVSELPVHLTHFIGRDRELDELARLLASARFVTLTGAGGSGKSRLAREAALAAGPRIGRIVWTDLAPLGDAGLLAPQVAAALRIPSGPTAPRSARSPRRSATSPCSSCSTTAST